MAMLVGFSEKPGNEFILIEDGFEFKPQNNSSNEVNLDGFEIDYMDGTGFSYESHAIHITRDSAKYTYTERFRNQKKTYTWKPELIDLKNLYQTLVSNSFDKIAENAPIGEIYDLNVTTIKVTLENKKVEFSDNGRDFVKNEWQMAFNRIAWTIKNYALVNKTE